MSNSPQGFKDDSNGDPNTDLQDDYDYDYDYDYDQYGNMTKDQNKNITLIKYNHLNLPVEIDFTENRKIFYTYDATGQKLIKDVRTGSFHTFTYYKDGFQYELQTPTLAGTTPQLLFFPTSEGYIKPVNNQENPYGAPIYSYVYNYTDHLGNIRLSYSADKYGKAKKLEENHYYPFGLKHSAYNQTRKKLSLKTTIVNAQSIKEVYQKPVLQRDYKYKYNGKELQEEFGLNWYDYGARNYDLNNRWMSIDPLSEEYYSWSPYAYALNNPIYYIDPDGRSVEDTKDSNQITDWYKDKNGNIVYDKNVKNQQYLDNAGIEGTYIAPEFVGKNQNGMLFNFNSDGTITEIGVSSKVLDELEAETGMVIETLNIQTKEKKNATNMALAVAIPDLLAPDPGDASVVKPIVELIVVAAGLTTIAIKGKKYVASTTAAAVDFFCC